jgi:5'-methylthioadenosine phosphorylase
MAAAAPAGEQRLDRPSAGHDPAFRTTGTCRPRVDRPRTGASGPDHPSRRPGTLGPSRKRPPWTPGARADVGVIGGSGSSLVDAHGSSTRRSAASDTVAVGRVGDRQVVSCRGRRDHPAHRHPYRANLWALRSLGVRQIVAPCAVGACVRLGPEVRRPTNVDRTTRRIRPATTTALCTCVRRPMSGRARRRRRAGASSRPSPVDGGTMVVVDGPRFSTRAESRWYAAGWSLVNMTGRGPFWPASSPSFTSVALVTDLDAGVAVGDGDAGRVFRVFAENTAHACAGARHDRGTRSGSTLPVSRRTASVAHHAADRLPPNDHVKSVSPLPGLQAWHRPGPLNVIIQTHRFQGAVASSRTVNRQPPSVFATATLVVDVDQARTMASRTPAAGRSNGVVLGLRAAAPRNATSKTRGRSDSGFLRNRR